MASLPPEPKSPRFQGYLNLLHVAGSIASVSGLSMLWARQAFGELDAVDFVGGVALAATIIGFVALCLSCVLWARAKLLPGQQFLVHVAFWLLGLPFFAWVCFLLANVGVRFIGWITRILV